MHIQKMMITVAYDWLLLATNTNPLYLYLATPYTTYKHFVIIVK